MDARLQAELGTRLDEALRSQSLVIEYAQVAGGNVVGWSHVPGETVIGRLMAATGWRVRDSSEAAGRATLSVSDGGQT